MKLRITSLLLITLISSVFSQCKKDKTKCSNDTEFCALINSEDYNNTGTFIDNYLSSLKKKLSDKEKLERLKDWLKCKSCVANAEILCNSCIDTNPPQSELKIWFIVNGQQKVKNLDIVMSDPLKFGTFHD